MTKNPMIMQKIFNFFLSSHRNHPLSSLLLAICEEKKSVDDAITWWWNVYILEKKKKISLLWGTAVDYDYFYDVVTKAMIRL